MNLTHHFLMAMPGLGDEVFAKSVVYTPVEPRYDKVLLLLGLQSCMLSSEAGHA
jgi:putative AlgH/UPF0301 family transcriptional regulator